MPQFVYLSESFLAKCNQDGAKSVVLKYNADTAKFKLRTIGYLYTHTLKYKTAGDKSQVDKFFQSLPMKLEKEKISQPSKK